MPIENKGNEDFDDSPVSIPEDYYWGELNKVNFYENSENKVRVAITFDVEYDGETYEVPGFMNALFSISSDDEGMSSKMGNWFKKINKAEALEKSLADALDSSIESLEDEEKIEEFRNTVTALLAKEITSGNIKYYVDDINSEEAECLKTAINAVLAGRKVRIQVETVNGSSLISKFADVKEK